MSTPPTLEHRDARRRRIFALIGGLVAVVLVGTGVSAVVLRGGSEAARPAPTRIRIQPGEVVSETVGAPATFPHDQRDVLVQKVRQYVEAATIEPLRTARPARGLDKLFDPGALAALQGPNRGVLLDEGLPEVTGKLTAISQPVAIKALADASGAWVMASAQFDLKVRGALGDRTLRIARRGELLFVPVEGDWMVTAFDVFVERTGPGVDNAKGKGR